MTSDGQDDNEPLADRRRLAIVIGLALVIRIAALGVLFDGLKADPDAYRLIAENIAGEQAFGFDQTPTAYRPPLYPLLLSGCVALGIAIPWAIAACHLVLGLGTILLVWRLAHQAKLGRFAFLAALLVACDPILLNQSAQVMTETLATFLATLALVCLTRLSERPAYRHAITTGVCLGLAALCRPIFLVWTAFALGTLVFGRTRSQRRIEIAAVVFLACAIVLSPWILRNQITLGRPVVATTHGGYTLLLGNNPYFYEFLDRQPWGEVWDAEEFADAWRRELPTVARHDETARDRLAYDTAFTNIREAPRMFLYSSLVRVGRLWSPLPHKTLAQESVARRGLRYTTAAWYLAEFVLACWGLCRLWRCARLAPWVWGMLLAVSLTLVHAFYWSNLRMRAPVMPVVALFCAAGAAEAWTRLKNHKPL